MSGDGPIEAAEKQKWWVAPFTVRDGGPSFSEMWGTKAEVDEIARVRGFGKPKPASHSPKEMRPSRYARRDGLGSASTLHTLCYLGFLAARSGVVTAEDLVCDGSALHELAHYLEGVRTRGRRKQADLVLDAMLHLERLTPGVPPDHVEIWEAVSDAK